MHAGLDLEAWSVRDVPTPVRISLPLAMASASACLAAPVTVPRPYHKTATYHCDRAPVSILPSTVSVVYIDTLPYSSQSDREAPERRADPHTNYHTGIGSRVRQ